jgi:sarcosine oxidase
MTSIPERADVVVVGLGAMGAMTAWQAAERGATVVAIEQFSAAHNRGSSHGGSRIFRTILFEGADYVPMARASLELFRRLEKESGTTLLTMCGGVTIGTADGELIRDARKSAEEQGVDHEVLDAGQIRARFPQHVVVDDDVAVYETGARSAAPGAGDPGRRGRGTAVRCRDRHGDAGHGGPSR